MQITDIFTVIGHHFTDGQRAGEVTSVISDPDTKRERIDITLRGGNKVSVTPAEFVKNWQPVKGRK